MSKKIHFPVSLGEAIDKLTILLVKSIKRPNSNSERLEETSAFAAIYDQIGELLHAVLRHELGLKLQKINTALWGYEDMIRRAVRENDSETQLFASNKICALNEERAVVKNQINKQWGFDETDGKTYSK